VPSTGGAESVCRLGYHQNGDYRINGCGPAVAGDDGRLLAAGDLRAADFIVATAPFIWRLALMR